MTKGKKIRTRGKIQLSRYFQNLKEGDNVSIVRDLSVEFNFPERMQGRTGIVAKKRGRAYVVKIMDHDKEKKFIIKPIHLKKIAR
jgi:ribosomal protein L21E